MATKFFLRCSWFLILAISGCQPPSDPPKTYASYLQKKPFAVPFRCLELCVPVHLRSKIGPEKIELVQLLEQWGKDAFEPTGTSPQNGEIVIQEVFVQEKKLPVVPWPKSLFMIQYRERYDALLNVELKFMYEGKNIRWIFEVEGQQDVSETSSLIQRRKMLNDLYIRLINQLDAKVKKRLESIFGPTSS